MVTIKIKLSTSVRIFGRTDKDAITPELIEYFNEFFSGAVGQPQSVYVIVSPSNLQINLTDFVYDTTSSGLQLSLQFIYHGTIQQISALSLVIVDSNGNEWVVAQYSLSSPLNNVSNVIISWVFNFTYQQCSICEIYPDNLSQLLIAMFVPPSYTYGYITSITPSPPSLECQPISPVSTSYQNTTVSGIIPTPPNEQVTLTCNVLYDSVLVFTFSQTFTAQNTTLVVASLTMVT